MRIGITADLHWGIHPRYDRGVDKFIQETLSETELDLLVIAGDLAETQGLAGNRIGDHHREILRKLAEACECKIAWCAGNHDIWSFDPDVESNQIYYELLPAAAAECDCCFLDRGNLELPGLTVVGCYGHFDFSLRVDELTINGAEVLESHYLAQTPPGHTKPVWMDCLNIWWQWDDPEACRVICESGSERMKSALSREGAVLFVSHGVGRRELNGHAGSQVPESLFRNAFCGTERLESIVRLAHQPGRKVLAVSGHTHRQINQQTIDGIDYLNVGGDYGKPRLQLVEFPQPLQG